MKGLWPVEVLIIAVKLNDTVDYYTACKYSVVIPDLRRTDNLEVVSNAFSR